MNLQKGDAVVSVLLDLLRPTRLLVGRWITPGVVVESEEVTALVIGTAVHVFGHLVSVGIDIGGRVPNRNSSVASAVSVLPEIASNGLDIRSTVGRVIAVDDLVTAEE